MKPMKRILLAVTLAALSLYARGQADKGITLSLREDICDFSIMAVPGNTEGIAGTEYRHTFGTELSAGYRVTLDNRWEFSLTAGLMLHDYSLTSIFAEKDVPTHTTDDGLFTETEYQRYDKLTTVNLPIIAGVKYLFTTWADEKLWDIVPLLSARAGYVIGLTSIDGEYYHELATNPVSNPYGITPGIEYEWHNSHFDRQGVFCAVGIGARYNQLTLELEYTLQPRHFFGEQRFESYNVNGDAVSDPQKLHYDNHRDNGDGLTLRVSYNF